MGRCEQGQSSYSTTWTIAICKSENRWFRSMSEKLSASKETFESKETRLRRWRWYCWYMPRWLWWSTCLHGRKYIFRILRSESKLKLRLMRAKSARELTWLVLSVSVLVVPKKNTQVHILFWHLIRPDIDFEILRCICSTLKLLSMDRTNSGTKSKRSIRSNDYAKLSRR